MSSPFEDMTFSANKENIVLCLCKRGLYKATKDPMFSAGIDRFLWMCYCFAYHMYINKYDFRKEVTQFQLYSRIDKPGNSLYLILPDSSEKYNIECFTRMGLKIEEPDSLCRLILKPEFYPYTKIDMNPEIPPDEDWPLFIGYPILEEFFKEKFK